MSWAKWRLDVGEDEDRAVKICWMSTQFSNCLHRFLRDFCGFYSQRLSFQKQMFTVHILDGILVSCPPVAQTCLLDSFVFQWQDHLEQHTQRPDKFHFLQQIFKNTNRNRECLFCVSEGSLAVTFKHEILLFPYFFCCCSCFCCCWKKIPEGWLILFQSLHLSFSVQEFLFPVPVSVFWSGVDRLRMENL